MNAARPVFVSEVIGEGAAAHRLVRVGGWEFTAPANDAEHELLVDDTDLARHLGVGRHKLRELIRTYRDSRDIQPVTIFSPAGIKSRGRPGEGFCLTRADALFIVTRSNAPRAKAMTKEMIRVFLLAMEGLLVPAGHLPPDQAEALRRELADVRANGLAGVIGPARAERDILAPIAEAARLHPKGKRAGLRWMNNKLRNAVQFNGAKSPWRLLPLATLADLQREMEKAADELAKLAAKHGADRQISFPFGPGGR